MDTQQEKVCLGCNDSKLLEEYTNQKRGKYGKCSFCKDCDRKRHKKYREKDPERYKERSRINSKRRREVNREGYLSNKRLWREKNKEKVNEKWREAYAKNPELYRAHRKRVLEKDPEYFKWNSKKRKYGLTREGYGALLVSQGGTCAMCSATEGTQGKMLSVDHDHETGEIRGLLCDTHNRGIGLFGDSEDMLLRAVEYLRSHRKKRDEYLTE